MNEKDIMIDVNHMSHIYTDENGNDVRALDDVNLSIKRGEFVCIIGTNGSGKSNEIADMTYLKSEILFVKA